MDPSPPTKTIMDVLEEDDLRLSEQGQCISDAVESPLSLLHCQYFMFD